MLLTLCQDSYKMSLFYNTYSRCKAVTELLTRMMQNLHLRKCNNQSSLSTTKRHFRRNVEYFVREMIPAQQLIQSANRVLLRKFQMESKYEVCTNSNHHLLHWKTGQCTSVIEQFLYWNYCTTITTTLTV